MSKYFLYGDSIIGNDDTLKDFARCIYENCPMEAVIEDCEERKDFILDCVEGILEDDISRTDIDYAELLFKYRNEFGDLFFLMWDRGYQIPTIEFLGEAAKEFFNDIVYYYVLVHYDEFASGK